jgi:hypothetical protein
VRIMRSEFRIKFLFMPVRDHDEFGMSPIPKVAMR